MTHVLRVRGSQLSVFRVVDTQTRFPVGRLRRKSEMPEWLKANADHDSLYELWNGEKLGSMWIYDKLTGRFKRTATPE